ncbi:IS3 family transposase [Nocardia beijingensis]|uniref:IS3 family transposase n=1 Tax=Nocardia beijingensis TaxID=95162 RepID=UPI00331F0A15
MGAPRKFDEETRARAVRMYQDRIREHGESMAAARRHVGALLDIKPATLRNWVERAEEDLTGPAPVAVSESEELKALRREVAELRRANDILRTASAFFGSGGGRPPTAMIVDYIDAHRDRFGVDPICRVLTEHGVKIAPSTYYAAKKRGISDATLADAHAANAVFDLWRANRCVYGVRKLWHAARRVGHNLGRDQVARLMRLAGIDGIVRGRRTTITTQRDRNTAARHPDLIGRAWSVPSRPDQWWVADFTYCPTLSGFCYTAFCVDVYSRRILGWRVMTSKTTPLVTSVLEQALFTRRRTDFRFSATGLVHHSDAGSQYTSLAFTESLRESGVAGSIVSVGDALDNALMESAIGLYKAELIDQHPALTGRAELERETASWVHWYNTQRLHSAIGYLPPVEYEHLYHQQTISAEMA